MPILRCWCPATAGASSQSTVRLVALPRLIPEAGERASFHSVEFLGARLANLHTRVAYGRAVTGFCDWCQARGVPLPALSSPIVAAYYDELVERLSPASATAPDKN
jgi:hypothetical protein